MVYMCGKGNIILVEYTIHGNAYGSIVNVAS